MTLAGETYHRCTKCKTRKPASKFVKVKVRNGSERPQSWCKQCKSKDKAKRALTIKGKRKLKDDALKRFFGISVEDFERMESSQRGLCAICKKPQPPRNRQGRTMQITLAVDHCHKTGRIRGLLCDKCNFGIAHFDDNIETLKQAIAYLDQYAA